ncbi:MAG: hypothetical protein Q4E05_07540 [Pseudoclavibacter sp.]|nr:hypothetical protein [Pseudoclavibacter sp.]
MSHEGIDGTSADQERAAPTVSYPGAPEEPREPGPPAAPVETGAAAWGMGLLVFLPVPFLNIIAMLIGYSLQYQKHERPAGTIASANARNARLWGRTFLLCLAAAVLLGVIGATVLSASEGRAGWFGGSFLIASMLLILAVQIAHIVVTVTGMTIASAYGVYRAPGLGAREDGAS